MDIFTTDSSTGSDSGITVDIVSSGTTLVSGVGNFFLAQPGAIKNKKDNTIRFLMFY